MIDLKLIPAIVEEDKRLLSEPDSRDRDEQQYQLVRRACVEYCKAHPLGSLMDEDKLYDPIAQALAEENG